MITPGTSVSYWYCFKLLDRSRAMKFLCPQPSYPLFDYIARLAGVYMRHYRLDESRAWAIDLEHLEHQITTGTRAIVLISPHNPTGMVASEEQLRDLAEIAARHRLPIISDEVFSEFLFGLDSISAVAATKAPLVFTLNGFSKMFALPGMKIGWMAVSGDDDPGEEVRRRARTDLRYVSAGNEIAQFAVRNFQIGARVSDVITRDWMQRCRAAAVEGLQNVRSISREEAFTSRCRLPATKKRPRRNCCGRTESWSIPDISMTLRPDHLVMTFIDEPELVRGHFEKIAAACRSQNHE